MLFAQLTDFAIGLNGIAEISADGVKVTNKDAFRNSIIDELIITAVFSPFPEVKEAARWIIWSAGQDLGAYSASIQDLYVARGKDEYKDACVPAVNIRAMTYDSARALIRSMQKLNMGAALFEIAKSEIGYTFQRPGEYVAVVLAAAIKEGFEGPVCIQGDHFQINAKNYKANPDKEVSGVKNLIEEAIEAGFYNIDIDTSTLVDLDEPTIKEQQRLNFELSAKLTAHVRKNEPEGVTVSIGGEIGEVGGKNSTNEELEAYLDGYKEYLESILPGAKGQSKISIQTGTSHGGVPLPDGSVAEVALDFDCLRDLGITSREKYGLAGTVQHGASTLPDEAFNNFTKAQCIEVHLATGFQNLVYDHPAFPADIKDRIYAWLAVNAASDRKDGMTDEQFYYKTRKKGFGPFKLETWTMPESVMAPIMESLEEKFTFIFEQLAMKDTKDLMGKINSTKVKHEIPEALKNLL